MRTAPRVELVERGVEVDRDLAYAVTRELDSCRRDAQLECHARREQAFEQGDRYGIHIAGERDRRDARVRLDAIAQHRARPRVERDRRRTSRAPCDHQRVAGALEIVSLQRHERVAQWAWPGGVSSASRHEPERAGTFDVGLARAAVEIAELGRGFGLGTDEVEHGIDVDVWNGSGLATGGRPLTADAKPRGVLGAEHAGEQLEQQIDEEVAHGLAWNVLV